MFNPSTYNLFVFRSTLNTFPCFPRSLPDSISTMSPFTILHFLSGTIGALGALLYASSCLKLRQGRVRRKF